MIWGRTVALVNGRVFADGGESDAVRLTSRIVSVGEPPRRGDTVVDLDGAFVLPGLINAHDHLELNHYGRLKFRPQYANATEWIDDMRPRLDDPEILEARRHPLTERLFIGALKNVLSGVTTVAHHNPYYRELQRTMPLRVVRRYGWAHSFALQGRPAGARGEPGGDVALRWRRTAAEAPFFLHLAEGVDEDASSELSRLEALGCLSANTVLVHGVAIDFDGWRRVAHAGAGVVWCPASNVFLFGRTACLRGYLDHAGNGSRRVALGTDSRLTGSRDLLDELRDAAGTFSAPTSELFPMVTTNAASVIHAPQAGRIAEDGPADLVVVPPRGKTPIEALLATSRADVKLVMVNGRPLVADVPFAPVFPARGTTARALRVDGVSKLADSALARRVAGCPIGEPGVTAS